MRDWRMARIVPGGRGSCRRFDSGKQIHSLFVEGAAEGVDIDTAEPVVVNALTGTPDGAGGVSDASDWPATYVTI